MISQTFRQLFLFFAILILSSAQDYQGDYQGDYQDYQDYADGYAQQDNLYANYAMKQQEKAVGWVELGVFVFVDAVLISFFLTH